MSGFGVDWRVGKHDRTVESMKFLVALNKTAWVIFDGASMKFFCSERTVHTWDSLPAVHSQMSACFLFFLHALSFSADPRTTQDQYETNHDRP